MARVSAVAASLTAGEFSSAYNVYKLRDYSAYTQYKLKPVPITLSKS